MSKPLIENLRQFTQSAIEGKELETLSEVHVLDLAEDGEIKPHILIDSSKVIVYSSLSTIVNYSGASV